MRSITPVQGDAFAATVATARPKAPGLSLLAQQRVGQHLCLVYRGMSSDPMPDAIRIATERLESAVAELQRSDREFQRDLAGALPNLRAFAISLTHNSDRAADLVQDTMLRGWAKRRYFQTGTNLHAWLFTILRNSFFSEYRKRSREVQDTDGRHAARLTTAPAQVDQLHLQDLQAAIARLSADQRDALLLVAVEGLPYAQAADLCGCAVGTVKSRVNRARIRLVELLSYSEADWAADHVVQAALAPSRP